MFFVLIAKMTLLVNEQSCLAISGIAPIESATRLNQFVIEIEADCRLRVTVDEPEQVGVLVFDTILGGMFLSEEDGRLSHSIVSWAFNVKVLGEVWGCLRSEVDFRGQIWAEFRQIRFELLTMGDRKRRRIAHSKLAFDAYSKINTLNKLKTLLH